MDNKGRKGSTDKVYITVSTYLCNVDSVTTVGDMSELS